MDPVKAIWAEVEGESPVICVPRPSPEFPSWHDRRLGGGVRVRSGIVAIAMGAAATGTIATVGMGGYGRLPNRRQIRWP